MNTWMITVVASSAKARDGQRHVTDADREPAFFGVEDWIYFKASKENAELVGQIRFEIVLMKSNEISVNSGTDSACL